MTESTYKPFGDMTPEERATAVSVARAVLRANYEDAVAQVMAVVAPKLADGSINDPDRLRTTLIPQVMDSAYLRRAESSMEALAYSGHEANAALEHEAKMAMLQDVERRLTPQLRANIRPSERSTRRRPRPQ